MYRLPKDINLSFLENRVLDQVCIGFNDLILKFDELVVLTVTSKCNHETKTGIKTQIDNYAINANTICLLLGNRILEVNGCEAGTLFLKFSNGDTFTIYNDSDQYESYMINTPNLNIVV